MAANMAAKRGATALHRCAGCTGMSGSSSYHNPVRRRPAAWAVLSVLLAALLLVGGLQPAPLAAQTQSPVRLEVEAGYGGSYRVSHWFPVTVIASNEGPDVSGVLEWHYPLGDESIVLQHAIELPQGARKRLTFSVLSNSFTRLGEVRLLDGNREIQAEEVRIEPIEAERFVVGILSSDTTLLNSLAAMQPGNTTGTTVVRLDEALLPEEPMALTGIDALFVHDIATAELSNEQREALRLWVELGGQLVVSGGINADQTVPGLADLLPVEVEELASDVSLAALNTLVGQNPLPDSAATTVSSVVLQRGAQTLDGDSLLTRREYGAGQVVFVAFDLDVLRAWTGEPDLWEDVLEAKQHFMPAVSFRWQNRNLLLDVLQLPSLSLPSFGVLFLYIIGYIVVVGPLNFLVLRRLKRIDLAWITIPATVVLFVVATYGASFLIRGVRPQLLQAAVVQSFEGQEHGQATSFVGVFSPRRNTYTLSMPSTALVSPERFWRSNAETIVRWNDSGTQVRNVLIDVSSLRSFIIEETVAIDIDVRSNLQYRGQRIEGTIENQGSQPLNEALLVYNSRVVRLGTVAPGESREVEPADMDGSFPAQADAESEGLFNRQRMLDVLFNTNQFMGMAAPGLNQPGGIGREGAYLLTWQERPPLDVELNSMTDPPQGLTLHIVKLRD